MSHGLILRFRHHGLNKKPYDFLLDELNKAGLKYRTDKNAFGSRLFIFESQEDKNLALLLWPDYVWEGKPYTIPDNAWEKTPDDIQKILR